MQLTVTSSLDSVDSAQWNACTGGNSFLRHEFLSALEHSGCVGAGSGWEPRHLVLLSDDNGDRRLLGAVPMYLKTHSYGEYVFDWAWADAYERSGLHYYPKLVVAVPFTPATGPRILVAPDQDHARIGSALVDGALTVAQETGASSLHWLFTNERDTGLLEGKGLLRRTGMQFHWHNRDYRDFDDFLSGFSAAKRKKVKRERRYVREAGIVLERISGNEATDAHWERFHRFYLNTIRSRGAMPYLNLEFFRELGRTMPDQVLLILARYEDRHVAGALFLRGSDTLYGRYWGSSEEFHSLHFETCYYDPIAYCIEQGIQRFEAGAQGEHKLSRGFLPTPTWSVHWLAHPEFERAVSDYLARERIGMEHYMDDLNEHSPYRG
ncbi:MAG: GNAT family N-acetyltransferase [Acidiferrobacteraceae bacterium]|jgi:predicted N-acyltransferase